MVDQATLINKAEQLANDALILAGDVAQYSPQVQVTTGESPLVISLTVFMLACFVGYYVVWKVTSALHTPLMSVTNAISGIIIVGAITAIGNGDSFISITLGFFAVLLATVNIVGGFAVTQRMLQMFRK